jgi:hypothetical protein
MGRRDFLKLTGFAVAASALDALPAAPGGGAPTVQAATLRPVPAIPGAQLMISTPGIYQITGRVRLEEPLVEISGIGQTQSITWSGAQGEQPEAGFTAFEQFDGPGMVPEIRVRGGTLATLTVSPVVVQ